MSPADDTSKRATAPKKANVPLDPEAGSGADDEMVSLLDAASSPDDQPSTVSKVIHSAKLLLEHLSPGPQRNELLELLASRCYDQYEAVNDWQALEDACTFVVEALEAMDIREDYARLALLYAQCLQSRFMRGRNETDLENAIEWADKATALTRQLMEDGSDTLSLDKAMATLWLCRFTKVHQLDDSTEEEFELMINVALEAMEHATANETGVVRLTEAKSNLGLSYQLRWERSRQPESYDDLLRSIELEREVVAFVCADGDASARVAALSNLSFRLQRAYLCFLLDGLLPPGMNASESKRLLDEAIECLAASVAIRDKLLSAPSNTMTFVMYIRNFPPEHRADMLERCCECLRSSHENLLQLCSVSSQDDQKDNLSTFYGLSRYAAAATIQTNSDAYAALLILEQGRAMAAASQLVGVQEMEAVMSYDAALGAQFVEARNAVKQSFTSTVPYHERKRQVQHLHEIEDGLRAVPGLVRPSRALSQDEMLSLAEGEDIVVINVTDLRSDAIIISTGGMQIVHLPDLDEEQLSEKSWEIQTRLAKETDEEEVFHDLNTHLTELLRTLWKDLVRPVLDALGHDALPSPLQTWPRIRWVPTGVLSLYPLHAAGLGLHKKSNTMNRIISSYAFSLTSLFHTRARSKLTRQPCNSNDAQSPPKVVTVVMPETPGHHPLDLCNDEAKAISKAFPHSEKLTGPTTEDVLAMLAMNPQIVHFSCHGEVDYDRPMLSKLLTSDWAADPLTVDRLQLLDVRRSRLAFLSACFTANAGVENLQDESVHLAGTLMLAGFPSVVGSAWYVGQTAALAVVERFYERLAGQPDGEWDVAAALHWAILDFRETTRTAANRMRGDPVSWAPFMMFGG